MCTAIIYNGAHTHTHRKEKMHAICTSLNQLIWRQVLNILGESWDTRVFKSPPLYRGWLCFVVTLTMNFEGQIWNLLYLSQKWSDCHEAKSKHIDWILGLKCDHRVWPWPWNWPWMLKVKYRICYISAKNGPIATKRNTTISIELKAWNVTIKFDLGHNLDLEFLMSNMEFPISQLQLVWLPWNEKQTYRLISRPQMWPMALTLTMTLTFECWR